MENLFFIGLSHQRISYLSGTGTGSKVNRDQTERNKMRILATERVPPLPAIYEVYMEVCVYNPRSPGLPHRDKLHQN